MGGDNAPIKKGVGKKRTYKEERWREKKQRKKIINKGRGDGRKVVVEGEG